jgi:uncharacterized membrane protein
VAGPTAQERGLDRIIFFTDAVAAIAITLLILPLVDEVSTAASHGQRVEEFLADNASQALGFSISFAVIARLWMAHHSLFQHVRAHTPLLVWLNFLWAFTIAVLPLPTAVISQFEIDAAARALYIGTMAASSLVLTLILLTITRTPGVVDPTAPISAHSVSGSVISSGLFLLAWLVGTLSSAIGLWAMLALFLAGPLERLLTGPIGRLLDERGRHHP